MGVELAGLEEEALESREVGNLAATHPGRRDLSAVPVPRSPRGSPLPPPLALPEGGSPAGSGDPQDRLCFQEFHPPACASVWRAAQEPENA